jgi:hypothetical protein
MKKYEYHEGKQAQEDFEKGIKAIFQVPKVAVSRQRKSPLKSGLRKPANPALPAILAAKLKRSGLV